MLPGQNRSAGTHGCPNQRRTISCRTTALGPWCCSARMTFSDPQHAIGAHRSALAGSGMESIDELQRRIRVMEQRYADLRRIVHLLATSYTPPPHPAQIPLPAFKPSQVANFCGSAWAPVLRL